MTATPWHVEIRLLLVHPSEPRILLVPDGDGWCLPQVRPSQPFWWREIDRVTDLVQAELDREVSGLGCLWSCRDDERRECRGIFQFEASTEAVVAEGRWFCHAEVADLSVADGKEDRFSRTCLAELEGVSERDLRAPWDRQGWVDGAESWIHEQLRDLGWNLLRPIECVYRHGLSSIHRAETAAGIAYMKASSFLPTQVDEPRLTAFLSRHLGNRVPKPVRVHSENRWMLMEDFGEPMREGTEVERIAALQAFADVQLQSMSFVDELVTWCPDRRLEALARDAERLTEAIDLSTLTEEQWGAVRAAVPRLQAMAAELSRLGIPDTVGHGDLHLNNIAVAGDEFVFLDWGQGRVSHPFIDACGYVDDAGLSSVPPEYIDKWEDFAPREVLEAGLQLARPLKVLSETMDQLYFHEGIRQPEDYFTGHLLELGRLVGTA